MWWVHPILTDPATLKKGQKISLKKEIVPKPEDGVAQKKNIPQKKMKKQKRNGLGINAAKK